MTYVNMVDLYLVCTAKYSDKGFLLSLTLYR
jgi:hypothetical protein